MAARDGRQNDGRNNAAHDPPTLKCERRHATSATPTGWRVQGPPKAQATSIGEAQTTPDDHTKSVNGEGPMNHDVRRRRLKKETGSPNE